MFGSYSVSALSILLLVVGCISSGDDVFYSSVDYIKTDINQLNFADTVIKSPSVWVIEFYAPWCPHCRNFQSDFQLAAENLKGLVNFAAINCDLEELKPLCGYFKVEALPSVLAFKSTLEPVEIEGTKSFSKVPVKYTGPLKPAALVKWASNFLADPIDPVVSINKNNIDRFVAEKQVNHKALLFSDKDKKSNLLRAVALQFRMDFLTEYWLPVGQVQNTETDIVTKYEISSFPTLLIVNKNGDKVATYSGQYNVAEITEFFKQNAHLATEEDKNPSQRNSAPPPPPPSPAKSKELKLHHVTDQESFDSTCYQMGLCFIVFLDSQSEDHPSYISTLEKLVPLLPSVQTMWIDGPKHSTFQSAFGVADSYPQAVAYQRKSKRYRAFLGGFEIEQMKEFIELVQSGATKKGRISILDAEPALGSEEKEDL